MKCDEEFKRLCQKENSDIYSKSAFEERYAWLMENVIVFDEAIEAKGALSLWENIKYRK